MWPAARGLGPDERETLSNGVARCSSAIPTATRSGSPARHLNPLLDRKRTDGMRAQREAKPASTRRREISLLTSSFGRGRSMEKCRELLVIV